MRYTLTAPKEGAPREAFSVANQCVLARLLGSALQPTSSLLLIENQWGMVEMG